MLAVTEDHRALSETAVDFLHRHRALAAARELLEADQEALPPFWGELVALGWLGLHLPEEHGGSGYGLEELAVVLEATGTALTPGPFLPTVIASAAIAATGSAAQKAAWLPGLADGSTAAAIALDGDLTVSGGTASGAAGTALGGNFGGILVAVAGPDVIVADLSAAGLAVANRANMDPTRRSTQITLDGTPVEVIAGAAGKLVDLARFATAAESIGACRAATDAAAAYAKERLQFGRVIGTYQAVKHHCANMEVATTLATALVWDAARTEGDVEFSFAAAMAGLKAVEAADLCANLNMQVHGGIGFTWEHDAHLFLRRATALASFVPPARSARDTTGHVRDGVKLTRGVELPPEAEDLRTAVRSLAESIKDLSAQDQRTKLIETGYVMPHWPKPWGRDAGAVEQLVIEEEFKRAGVKRPAYGITGWVILTLIQHGNDDQVQRWVPSALTQEVIWCQLFSEPDAGSDAAGIKTKATRVDGGWLVNGQKVWTSGAHVSGMGFATVRTNPDVPKHQGITTMVIDMHAEGVEVRPIKMTTGNSEFNEVFFNDVFVPDDDVVGPIDGGWTVARATLGNESVSIGGGQGGMTTGGEAFIPGYDAHPERLAGGEERIGRYIADHQGMAAVNVRSVHRAVAGQPPTSDGYITKLVLSELGHEAAAILPALAGPDAAFLDGAGAIGGQLALWHRGMSIAGGTSEIKRNQIGERILGLPRDPLIS